MRDTPPRLVIEARQPLWIWAVVATVVPLQVAAVFVASLHEVKIPWMTDGHAAAVFWILLVAFPFVVGVVLARLAFRWTRAEFHDGLVVLRRDEGRGYEVSFGELAGYRDDRADRVRLVRNGPGPRLDIPTATEKDRIAVLAFLDGAGLKRVE